MQFTVKHISSYKGNDTKLVAITLDGSYVTNGWHITPANCQLRAIRSLIISGSAAGYPLHWDQANLKLKAFSSVGGESAGNNASLNGIVVYALVEGY